MKILSAVPALLQVLLITLQQHQANAWYFGDDSRVTWRNVPSTEAGNAGAAWVAGQTVQFSFKWNRSPKDPQDYIITIDANDHFKRMLKNVAVQGPDAEGFYHASAVIPSDISTDDDYKLKLESKYIHRDFAEIEDVRILAAKDATSTASTSDTSPTTSVFPSTSETLMVTSDYHPSPSISETIMVTSMEHVVPTDVAPSASIPGTSMDLPTNTIDPVNNAFNSISGPSISVTPVVNYDNPHETIASVPVVAPTESASCTHMAHESVTDNIVYHTTETSQIVPTQEPVQGPVLDYGQSFASSSIPVVPVSSFYDATVATTAASIPATEIAAVQSNVPAPENHVSLETNGFKVNPIPTETIVAVEQTPQVEIPQPTDAGYGSPVSSASAVAPSDIVVPTDAVIYTTVVATPAPLPAQKCLPRPL